MLAIIARICVRSATFCARVCDNLWAGSAKSCVQIRAQFGGEFHQLGTKSGPILCAFCVDLSSVARGPRLSSVANSVLCSVPAWLRGVQVPWGLGAVLLVLVAGHGAGLRVEARWCPWHVLHHPVPPFSAVSRGWPLTSRAQCTAQKVQRTSRKMRWRRCRGCGRCRRRTRCTRPTSVFRNPSNLPK